MVLIMSEIITEQMFFKQSGPILYPPNVEKDFSATVESATQGDVWPHRR